MEAILLENGGVKAYKLLDHRTRTYTRLSGFEPEPKSRKLYNYKHPYKNIVAGLTILPRPPLLINYVLAKSC